VRKLPLLWTLCAAASPAVAQQGVDDALKRGRLEPLAPHLNVAQANQAAHLNVSRNEAIRSGVQWLIDNQNPKGTWGSHHSPRWYEVLCDVPGSHNAFRVATTSLGVMALMDSPYKSEASAAALSRGVDALIAEHDVKRANKMEHYSVWAFGYGLRAMSEYLLAHPDDERKEEILAACESLVVKLGKYQALDGGWGYLSLEAPVTYQPSFTSMSFTTATCLVGLARARDLGLELPQQMIDRAVSSVARCETPMKAFTYGELWRRSPHTSVNHIKGAACRVPVCLEALRLWGREVEAERIEHALESLLRAYARFQIAGLRRPVPHESHYGVSGYFYLYGHAYAALLMEQLSEEAQIANGPDLQRAVLLCRQPDGSFWDYPLYSYHKAYGTAFAIMALARVPEASVAFASPSESRR
jgi:Family of unknown function (DUF6288)